MRDNMYYDTRGPEIDFAGRSFLTGKPIGHDQDTSSLTLSSSTQVTLNFRLRPESPRSQERLSANRYDCYRPRVRAGADTW